MSESQDPELRRRSIGVRITEIVMILVQIGNAVASVLVAKRSSAGEGLLCFVVVFAVTYIVYAFIIARLTVITGRD
jgi:hypothetical protein